MVEVKELKGFDQTIKRTKVGEVVVSTVKLGSEVKEIDSFLGMFDAVMDRPAKLSDPGDYETMVFSCDAEGNVTNWTELDFARYADRNAAELGHSAMVETWRNK